MSRVGRNRSRRGYTRGFGSPGGPFVSVPRRKVMRRSSRSSGPGLRRFLPWVIVFLVLAIAPALALAQTADSVVVSWSAPGDDGAIGTATSQDPRVSAPPITAANF